MARSFMQLTDDEIKGILRDVVNQILIPKFQELNMNASGKWIDSLSVDFDRMKQKGIIRGMDYTRFLTVGRNPNADQSEEALRAWAVWAGNTFIGQWVRDKGLTADPIAVAYSIAKNGTTWKRQGGSDLLEVLQTDETKAFIAEKISSVMRVKVAEQLRRNALETFN